MEEAAFAEGRGPDPAAIDNTNDALLTLTEAPQGPVATIGLLSRARKRADGRSAEVYRAAPVSSSCRDGEFACLDLQLDWDDEAVRLRVAKRGAYVLPYDSIAVAIPVAERRRLVVSPTAM